MRTIRIPKTVTLEVKTSHQPEWQKLGTFADANAADAYIADHNARNALHATRPMIVASRILPKSRIP